ncbi:MAG TPA: hypothetical protein VE998_01800 [Terriglobales bacterium]|nr:hypothetical protein [Terriglobales bacterium]
MMLPSARSSMREKLNLRWPISDQPALARLPRSPTWLPPACSRLQTEALIELLAMLPG